MRSILQFFCLYRPVAAGHFGPSSSGGLGAPPLGAFFLRISFSDLKGDVSSCVGRLKRVLFLSNLKMKSEEKKKLQAAMHQAAVHQAAVHQDLLKRTDQNVRPQQACRGKKNVRKSIIILKLYQSICLSIYLLMVNNNLKLYIVVVHVNNLNYIHLSIYVLPSLFKLKPESILLH